MSPDFAPGFPWDFRPEPSALAKARAIPKAKRPLWLRGETDWNVYSSVRALAPNLRVSDTNPPAALRGLVVDYDAKSSVEVALGFIDQMKPEFQPNFLELSLGLRLRLVWLFPRELLVKDSAHCRCILEAFFTKLGLFNLLAGYDEHSLNPALRWTNGGEWYDLRREPLSWDLVLGIAVDASKKIGGTSEVPLEKVAAEVERRFPNRWKGEFKLDASGVRFWAEEADNETGCQVKPDGMLVFSGIPAVGFMKWAEIFGPAWVNEQRALHLGNAAAGIYYDGKRAWQFVAERWRDYGIEDICRDFRDVGLSGKVGKGQTCSDVDRVLNFVRRNNAIDGAAPLVNYAPGLVRFNGDLLLNTYAGVPLAPAASAKGAYEEFPWIWKLINGVFDTTHSPLVPHYWLAWVQRFYRAQCQHQRTFGQALFVVGPRNTGKSLFVEHILQRLIGGKLSDPYELFMGKTTFSDDVCASPLLFLDDSRSPDSEKEKRAFLFSVKSWVVSPSHTYHPKFNKRVSLPWSGRIVVTCNDDPRSIGILPEVNHNTADKVIFIASRPLSEPWPTKSENERRIHEELPYFARFLMDVYEPPAEIVDNSRMGIKSFHDPRILQLSQQEIQAYGLTELLVQWCELSSDYWDKSSKWEGTPTALLNQIGNHFDTVAREWTVNKIATALALFSSREGSGITRLAGSRTYQIDRDVILAPSVAPKTI